eukprot:TRINITY_DN7623_c0_g1_i1.p1 TRINITY_DN7623_c0_g1~~TRINITY_DN7623_c0_g1_i1.p1  ORF type:complete len:303 (-),score=59.34 TRINITY_DN7623_c0_g1_i1:23-931(-)
MSVQLKEVEIEVFAHTEQCSKWFSTQNDLCGTGQHINWEDVLKKFLYTRFQNTGLSLYNTNVLVDARPYYTIAIIKSSPLIPKILTDSSSDPIFYLSPSTLIKFNPTSSKIHPLPNYNKSMTLSNLYKSLSILTPPNINPNSQSLPIFNSLIIQQSISQLQGKAQQSSTLKLFLQSHCGNLESSARPLLIKTESIEHIDSILRTVFIDIIGIGVERMYLNEGAANKDKEQVFEEAVRKVEKEGSCVVIVSGDILDTTNGMVLYKMNEMLEYCMSQRIVFVGITQGRNSITQLTAQDPFVMSM